MVKCELCKKKLGLSNYVVCKCSLTFCFKHISHSEHNCQYDYKKNNKEQLLLQNPVCVNEKIRSI